MAQKNMILEILEDNNIQELFVEDEITPLVIEDWIACPKNPDNNKEQMIPLALIAEWVDQLRSMPDVIEISNEEAGFNSVRGSGKDLRIALHLQLQGAIKNPKKNLEFEKVFNPIRETLISILAKRLSFEAFIQEKSNHASQEAQNTSENDFPSPVENDDDPIDAEFATQAI